MEGGKEKKDRKEFEGRKESETKIGLNDVPWCVCMIGISILLVTSTAFLEICAAAKKNDHIIDLMPSSFDHRPLFIYKWIADILL